MKIFVLFGLISANSFLRNDEFEILESSGMGTDAVVITEAWTTAETEADTTTTEDLPVGTATTTTTEGTDAGTEGPVTEDTTTDIIETTTEEEILPIDTTTELINGTTSTTTPTTTKMTETTTESIDDTTEAMMNTAFTTESSKSDDGPNLGLILGLTFGILGAIGGGVLIWYCCIANNTVDVADVEMGEQDDNSSDESSSDESSQD